MGLKPGEEQLIAQLAQRIDHLGMSRPALLFLEAHRPLGFLGAQALVFLQPILGINGAVLRQYTQLLEEPDAINRLIEHLEAKDVD